MTIYIFNDTSNKYLIVLNVLGNRPKLTKIILKLRLKKVLNIYFRPMPLKIELFTFNILQKNEISYIRIKNSDKKSMIISNFFILHN